MSLQSLGCSMRSALLLWLESRSRSWTTEKTGRNYRLMLEAWVPFLGGHDLRTIKPVDVHALYLLRDNGRRSAAWLNKERDTLHAFFTWAIGLDLLDGNPVTSASWPRKKGEGKRKFLLIDPGMLEQIIDLLPIRYHRLLVFMYLTALRISEALAATWRWVIMDPRDSSAWILRVPARSTKTRREYTVPLSERAMGILGQRHEDDEHLFAEIRSAHSVRGALQRVGRKLGIEHLSPHQFRRSCATNLANEGMPLPAVQRYVGWKSAPKAWLEMFEHSYYLGQEGSKARSMQERLWPRK